MAMFKLPEPLKVRFLSSEGVNVTTSSFVVTQEELDNGPSLLDFIGHDRDGWPMYCRRHRG